MHTPSKAAEYKIMILKLIHININNYNSELHITSKPAEYKIIISDKRIAYTMKSCGIYDNDTQINAYIHIQL